MWHRYIIVTVVIFALVSTALGACKIPNESHAIDLAFGTLNEGNVSNSSCDHWKLSQSVVGEDDTCSSFSGYGRSRNNTYLLFEFWRNVPEAKYPRSSRLVVFMVVRGSQPTATFDNGVYSYDPPLADEPQLGDSGTLVDSAVMYSERSYQRIVVPLGAQSTNGADWYVTVANLVDPQPVQYKFRVHALTVPCSGCSPRHAPDVDRPLLNTICYCQRDWGDYNCQIRAPQLSNGDVVSALLSPGQWSYWQLSVPLPANWAETRGLYPALLVELSRSGGDRFPPGPAVGPYGGNPVLMVMPKKADEGNRVPYDRDGFADWSSFVLQQNFHYVLDRHLAEHLWDDIHTCRHPFRRCSDPYDPAAKSTALGSPGKTIPATNEFLCTCNKGYGGPMCEGTIKNLTLSTWGDSGSGYLEPGQWTFFAFYVDPGRFDNSSDDAIIQWVVRNVNGSGANEPLPYRNALLTVNKMAFPRLPQSLNGLGDLLSRGWLVRYDMLFLEGGQWKPIRVVGSLLEPGYSYVLGMYNSDYSLQAPYNYTISMYVPTQSRTWLHPYMSVVLGVSASIILCLIMTLCRRVLQRYGWGPFRPRGSMLDGGGPDGGGNLSRVQAGQLHRGVPAEIIDGFHSYKYRATSAEKAQLAKSRPEPEPQPAQPSRQPSQAALQAQLIAPGNGDARLESSRGEAAGQGAVELVRIGAPPAVAGGGGLGKPVATTSAEAAAEMAPASGSNDGSKRTSLAPFAECLSYPNNVDRRKTDQEVRATREGSSLSYGCTGSSSGRSRCSCRRLCRQRCPPQRIPGRMPSLLLAAQLLARGPSATLDSPLYHSRSGRGNGGAASAAIASAAPPEALLPTVAVGSPPLSPSSCRLAAGRQSPVSPAGGLLTRAPGPDAAEAAKPGVIADTDHIATGVVADYDDQGKLVSLDIRTASKRTPCHVFNSGAEVDGKQPLAVNWHHNTEHERLVVRLSLRDRYAVNAAFYR
ncbi:hypothetical protein VOLCADRAFT_95862 [Volvox carteri f. nagariensis]|uniref:EGF-like domain-containing protein n=1 Tax=Volvox carteri f. nagariensis TaxID=3068 RepID=D8U8K5_VOLCA|nr:uncharacterized protein VOLCADRAFT_95862 [Volvox carteri f. nagariensis]EFJ43998.1 hypothetical protein VOLCADRAFT_95862 [Volvox carteri f. nagariensis]|eukprot:XP_002955010.1 hypothetical protein VOLCADRAFT_95862 [Volvox carteri f. nagariensis]